MPRTGEFRICAKKFFLTYPQAPEITKQQVLQNIKEFFGLNLDKCVVAEESHLDGNKHFHCFIILKEKYDCQNPNTFDIFAGKHGNYQVMKHAKECYEYNVKEDILPATFGDVSCFQKKISKWLEIAKAIDNGASLSDIRTDFKGMYIQYRSKIHEYYDEVHDKARDPNEPVEVTVLWGPPGTGKSRWCWKKFPNALIKTDLKQTKFWDRYTGQDTVVINDFRGADIKMNDLLNLLDRYPDVKEKKGHRGGVNLNVKRWIITSNYHPSQWYKKAWDIENPLRRRITSIVEFKRTEQMQINEPIETVYIDSDVEEETIPTENDRPPQELWRSSNIPRIEVDPIHDDEQIALEMMENMEILHASDLSEQRMPTNEYDGNGDEMDPNH